MLKIINTKNITPVVSKNTFRAKEVQTAEEQKTNKKNSKGLVGVLSALAIIGIAGVALYKHKNTKETVQKAEKAGEKAFEKFYGEEAKAGIEYLEKEAFEKNSEKLASDARNNAWLEEQHSIKEKELQEFFDRELSAKDKRDYLAQFNSEEAKAGIEYLEKEACEKNSEKLASDARNNAWLEEQHSIKEKEQNDLFNLSDNKESILQEYEQKLNGNITVTVPQKPTNYEHNQLQAEYDKLGIPTLKKKSQNQTTQELQERVWKYRTDKQVSEYEQKLNGNITVTVPQKPTNYEHNQLQAEYNKLGISTLKKKSQNPTTQELQERVWKHRTDKQVSEYEQKLNGNITVTVPQKPTNYEHNQLQAEYDKLGIPTLKKKSQNQTTQELQERVWKYRTDKQVSEYEQKLNGNITVTVPQKPTNYEHNQLQAEYDKLGIPTLKKKSQNQTTQELQERVWKYRTDKQVSEYEQKLNGNITVTVPQKPTPSWHNKIQRQFEKVFGIKKEVQKQDSITIQPLPEKVEPQIVETPQIALKGLNELPESFNEQERHLVKYLYRNTRLPKDKVTEYPKLYKTEKEAKEAKKEYQKLKKAHIERRVNNYANHVGVSDPETAISNTYIIPDSEKFSAKKYASMSKERPRPEDWEVEMTREEFMKNKERYMVENFERERKTQGVKQFENPKRRITLSDKIKKFFGF